jgi:hypothetical protein
VAKVLSQLIKDVREKGVFSGVKVACQETITHLIIVDDVLCFSQGFMRGISFLKGVLDLYCKAICIEINVNN